MSAKSYATTANQPSRVSENTNPRKVKNTDGGGYVFEISERELFTRFLILGTIEGSYYESPEQMTKRGVGVMDSLIAQGDYNWMLDEIIAISEDRRAPKQSPAIFALAYLSTVKNSEFLSRLYVEMLRVCRTGSTFLEWVDVCNYLRGWGTGLQNACARWLQSRTPDELAYQIAKYPQRGGFSFRDVLRLCKVSHWGHENNSVYAWVTGREIEGELPHILKGVNAIKALNEKDGKGAASLIQEYGLTREMVPGYMLNLPEVWRAFTPNMPTTALVRNLGALTSRGLCEQGEPGLIRAEQVLKSEKAMSGLHPYNVGMALKTYQSGKGVRGGLTWNPVPRIVHLLDDAIDMTFGTYEPTGKSVCIGIDTSGSMSGHYYGYSNSPRPAMTPLEAEVLMMMPLYRNEPNTRIYAFSHELVDMAPYISPRDGFNSALNAVRSHAVIGSTDPGLLIQQAMRDKRVYDVFIVMTDNEVNRGYAVDELLAQYRREYNPNAKLIVCGFTATNFTIGDPRDPNILNIAGMDASLPQLVRAFMSL